MSDLARPTGIAWEAANQYGQVKFGNDDLTMAIFYTHAVLNPIKSEEANRPIFDNVAYVRIQPPGERLNIVIRPVQPGDKKRWAKQWDEYINNRLQVPEGTPVEQLFVNHPAIAETLKGAHVFTVEQLASLSGNALDSIGMGAQEWVNKAKAYLDSANKGKDFNKLVSRLEDAEANNRVLNQQLQLAMAQIKAMQERQSNDPAKNSLNPGHVQGIDPLSDRIKANRDAIVNTEITPQQLKQAKKDNKSDDPYNIDTGEF